MYLQQGSLANDYCAIVLENLKLLVIIILTNLVEENF